MIYRWLVDIYYKLAVWYYDYQVGQLHKNLDSIDEESLEKLLNDLKGLEDES